jgi:hypothetical protein
VQTTLSDDAVSRVAISASREVESGDYRMSNDTATIAARKLANDGQANRSSTAIEAAYDGWETIGQGAIAALADGGTQAGLIETIAQHLPEGSMKSTLLGFAQVIGGDEWEGRQAFRRAIVQDRGNQEAREQYGQLKQRRIRELQEGITGEWCPIAIGSMKSELFQLRNETL